MGYLKAIPFKGVGNMTDATTYGTIEANYQSILYSILKNDSTVSAITTNVLDGDPPTLSRGLGFPYIVINIPTVDEELPVFGGSISQCEVSAVITIYSKKESQVRVLGGAVRNAIRSNRSTLEVDGKLHLEGKSITGSLSQRYLETGRGQERSTPVWQYQIIIPVVFVG